jgi:hypothetical protein
MDDWCLILAIAVVFAPLETAVPDGWTTDRITGMIR